jgi:nickel-dependent lactate racemase
MVSKCREGVGHATFLKQLSTSKDPKKVLEELGKEYKLGYHKAAKMAEIMVWADVWAVTDLDDELICSANMKQFRTVADAVKEAFKEDPKARVLILMDGSVTIPKVSK